MTRRAVLCARVSGEDWSNDGRNLESQIGMARQYALERGYVVVEESAWCAASEARCRPGTFSPWAGSLTAIGPAQ